MASKIVYIVSGRSASSSNPGRKISEIISLWSKKYSVYPVFGGDICLGVGKKSNYSYGHADVHNSNLRDTYLWRSFSECKDIIHNFFTLVTIVFRFFKNKPSLVWERSSRLHWSGLTYSKVFKVPYVLEWKDHLILDGKSFFKKLSIYIEKKKIIYSSYIVVESYVLKEYLVKEYSIDKNKIIVAFNAVNYEDFINVQSELEKKLNIPCFKNNFLVGYLGSYAFYHDSKRLVLAAALLVNSYPDIFIVMVGDGKDRKECENLAKKLGVFERNLFFVPPVSKNEVPIVLSQLNAAVLPGSTDIICPIKIMEYMAAALPVIAPSYICNKEIINDSENGFLFEPENEYSLRDAIIKIYSSPELSQFAAENARKFVAEKLSWENTWGKALDEILFK